MLDHAFEELDAADTPCAASDSVLDGLPAVSASEIEHIPVSDGFAQRKVPKQFEKVVEMISFEVRLRERSTVTLGPETLR